MPRRVGTTMPRLGTNSSRSERADERAAGTVRIPGETDPLNVTIAISDESVTMKSGDLELGSWSQSDVTIRRIDPFSFAFTAEGDRLVFVPDDARSFAKLPIVTSGPSAQPKKRPLLAQRRQARATRPKRSLGDRVRIPRPAISIPRRARSTSPIPPSPMPIAASAPSGNAPSQSSADERTLWLKAVDMARENEWLGLNRVPFHPEQRGREHQHTYDHGAAAKSGPSGRICTVCGQIRPRG